MSPPANSSGKQKGQGHIFGDRTHYRWIWPLERHTFQKKYPYCLQPCKFWARECLENIAGQLAETPMCGGPVRRPRSRRSSRRWPESLMRGNGRVDSAHLCLRFSHLLLHKWVWPTPRPTRGKKRTETTDTRVSEILFFWGKKDWKSLKINGGEALKLFVISRSCVRVTSLAPKSTWNLWISGAFCCKKLYISGRWTAPCQVEKARNKNYAEDSISCGIICIVFILLKLRSIRRCHTANLFLAPVVVIKINICADRLPQSFVILEMIEVIHFCFQDSLESSIGALPR